MLSECETKFSDRRTQKFGGWLGQAVYWMYARARWVDSGIGPRDPGFHELMLMTAQEFVVLRPTADQVLWGKDMLFKALDVG